MVESVKKGMKSVGGESVSDRRIYFIGMNCPSKKNAKQITRNKRIISSKTVRRYEKEMETVYRENKDKFIEKTKDKQFPLRIGFYFFRDSKRKWDFCNIIQEPLDLFQEYGYIEDDDTKHVIPIYLGETVVKKKDSGFFIEIL